MNDDYWNGHTGCTKLVRESRSRIGTYVSEVITEEGFLNFKQIRKDIIVTAKILFHSGTYIIILHLIFQI